MQCTPDLLLKEENAKRWLLKLMETEICLLSLKRIGRSTSKEKGKRNLHLENEKDESESY